MYGIFHSNIGKIAEGTRDVDDSVAACDSKVRKGVGLNSRWKVSSKAGVLNRMARPASAVRVEERFSVTLVYSQPRRL